MIHIQDILVPDRQQDEDGQNTAGQEGDEFGQHSGQGRHKDVHVITSWFVRSEG